MKKVLFVSKDMGGVNIAAPLADEFVRGGYSVIIIAEGLASAIFEKRGFSLYFKGSINFLEEPFTLDAMAVIKKINPDIIICTDGSPIHLEEKFGLAANCLKVPLVFLYAPERKSLPPCRKYCFYTEDLLRQMFDIQTL